MSRTASLLRRECPNLAHLRQLAAGYERQLSIREGTAAIGKRSDCYGEGFRMPALVAIRARSQGPASESPQGRNPRAAGLAVDDYGDLTGQRSRRAIRWLAQPAASCR